MRDLTDHVRERDEAEGPPEMSDCEHCEVPRTEPSWKVGDKVKCMEPSGSLGVLKLGKVYTIIGFYENDDLEFAEDEGAGWHRGRFDRVAT